MNVLLLLLLGWGQVNRRITITLAAWQPATSHLLLGFLVKLRDEDIAEIQGIQDVTTATNFGSKIAKTGFVCRLHVTDNDKAIAYCLM